MFRGEWFLANVLEGIPRADLNTGGGAFRPSSCRIVDRVQLVPREENERLEVELKTFPGREHGGRLFAPLDQATRNIFTLLAFAAGFAVRPFGALVFGRLGDLIGRKHTFLTTILIMGASTFVPAFLPGYASWGLGGSGLLDCSQAPARPGARG